MKSLSLDNQVIHPDAFSKADFESFFLENLPQNQSYLKPQDEPVILKIDRLTHEMTP